MYGTTRIKLKVWYHSVISELLARGCRRRRTGGGGDRSRKRWKQTNKKQKNFHMRERLSPTNADLKTKYTCMSGSRCSGALGTLIYISFRKTFFLFLFLSFRTRRRRPKCLQHLEQRRHTHRSRTALRIPLVGFLFLCFKLSTRGKFISHACERICQACPPIGSTKL